MPHYLRVARALALVSGTLGSAGCYQSHERAVDVGPIDAWSADTNVDAGPCPVPLPCTCPTLSSDGTCGGTTFMMCCPVVGPLSPPDLALA